MEVFKVKKVEDLKVTVVENGNEVMQCERKIVLTNLNDCEDYDITLCHDDALIPLEEGQYVIAALRCEHYRVYDEDYHRYYVLSISPIRGKIKFEFEKPNWDRFCRN